MVSCLPSAHAAINSLRKATRHFKCCNSNIYTLGHLSHVHDFCMFYNFYIIAARMHIYMLLFDDYAFYGCNKHILKEWICNV